MQSSAFIKGSLRTAAIIVAIATAMGQASYAQTAPAGATSPSSLQTNPNIYDKNLDYSLRQARYAARRVRTLSTVHGQCSSLDQRLAPLIARLAEASNAEVHSLANTLDHSLRNLKDVCDEKSRTLDYLMQQLESTDHYIGGVTLQVGAELNFGRSALRLAGIPLVTPNTGGFASYSLFSLFININDFFGGSSANIPMDLVGVTPYSFGSMPTSPLEPMINLVFFVAPRQTIRSLSDFRGYYAGLSTDFNSPWKSQYNANSLTQFAVYMHTSAPIYAVILPILGSVKWVGQNAKDLTGALSIQGFRVGVGDTPGSGTRPTDLTWEEQSRELFSLFSDWLGYD